MGVPQEIYQSFVHYFIYRITFIRHLYIERENFITYIYTILIFTELILDNYSIYTYILRFL